MKRWGSLVLTVVMLAGLLGDLSAVGGRIPGASAADSGPVLWYKFDEGSGSVVSDASGNGHDGTLHGGYAWTTAPNGSGAIELNGTNGYVQMPDGLLAGLTDITITANVYVDPGNVNPAWIFTFGSTTDPINDPEANYLGLLIDRDNRFRAAITSQRWSGEQNANKGAPLAKGVWKSVAFTLSGTTGTLYEDGVVVARNANMTLDPQDMEPTIANFLGLPAYVQDKYLKGKISDFRIYDRALSEEEVRGIWIESLSDADAVQAVKGLLDLGDTSAVLTDLHLPTAMGNVSISWTSSHPEVITNDGKVTRPDEDTAVTLTAAISRGSVTDTKEFVVTVLKRQLTLLTDVKEIDLFLNGSHALAVMATEDGQSFRDVTAEATYASSDPAVATVNEQGVITAEGMGSADITVTYEGVSVVVKVHVERDLMLWYTFDEDGGTSVADRSGNGRNGTLSGGAGFGPGFDGNVLELDGASGHVVLPAGLLQDVSDITISAYVYLDPTISSPTWLFGFGNTSTTGYLFISPNRGSSIRFGITTTNWQGEQPVDAPALEKGVWKHVAATLSGNLAILYVDGVEVGRNAAVTRKPSDLAPNSANYIGRSLYPDPYFKGKIDDFRVYKRALTASEIASLNRMNDQKIVEADQEALDLGDTSAVTADLALPSKGLYGSSITWSSDRPEIIAPNGKVTRPAPGQGDAVVTLTATIRRGNVQAVKTFTVTVPEEPDDARAVELDKEALVVHNIDDVRGNLTLPTSGPHGTHITWASEDPSIITPTGEVNRPPHGSGDVTVKLTATISKGEASATKEFLATVRELPAREELAGYLFTYFTGEGSPNGEQIYFALSKGNDPLRYQALNGGRPVLVSQLGEMGVRDPFIIRSPEGDKFYLLATDLKIYGNGDWDRAQRNGSRSIMIWESTDLVNWSQQRMVEVAPPEAGNVWAPEAFYDHEAGEYVVFWASKIYPDETHTGDTYLKMMYATTRDFYTFSEPRVYMDYGKATLDTTMIEHNGKIYRFTKEDHVIQEVGDSIFGEFRMINNNVESPHLARGEGPLIFKSNTEDKWYLFIDEYGLRGYVPLETTDLDSGEWTVSQGYEFPGRPRHGSVLPITKSEYEALYNKYLAAPVPVTGVSLHHDRWVMTLGEEKKFDVRIEPDHATNKAVTWSSSDESVVTVTDDGVVQAVGLGTATVTVTTVDGGFSDSMEIRVNESVEPHLLVWYKFEETDGTRVVDHSNHELHGVYVNTPAFGTGVDGQSFRMSGGPNTAVSPYVKIPNGILEGHDNLTIAAFVKWNGGAPNQWLFTLGQDNQKYLFVSPRGWEGMKAGITTGSWQEEQQFSAAEPLASNVWKHVAAVIDTDNHTATLYVDGAIVGRNQNVTIKPSELFDPSRDYSGYIGKSFYAADPYFGGEMDDFRIYNRALTQSEIAALAGNTTLVLGVETDGQKFDPIIDADRGRIVLRLNPGTDVTRLAPRFTLPAGSVIQPASGTEHDFSQPVTYTVTGQDGKTRNWVVEAKIVRSPVIPGYYADPHAAVFGNKFYIYPTTDGFEGWSSTSFKVFSSDNLVDWTDHGVIFDLSRDTTWAPGRAWAPAIAERNGKYYFYFSGDTNIGVAVADSPTGPFTDALGRPLIPKGAYSGQMIDPMVFIDDDGQAYLYFGNGRAYVVRLKEDMITLDGTPVDITPSGYREAAFVFKRNGKYYFMWSENDTRDVDYRVAYAIGDSPMGPFTKQGVILEKDLSLGIKGPGHHSVIQIPGKDEWYIVYHRHAIPDGDGMHREITIDRMEFNPDGTIRKVVPTLESIEPVVLTPPHVPVIGVTLDRDNLVLKVGEEAQLIAVVIPEDATNKAVVWSSSDEKVATVDADGKVKALKAGKALIRVTTVEGGFTAWMELTVLPSSDGEEPGGEEPGGEEPGGEEPGGEEPGSEEPGGEQPGGEKPGSEQPGGGQPGGPSPGQGTGPSQPSPQPESGQQPQPEESGEPEPGDEAPTDGTDTEPAPQPREFADTEQHWAKQSIDRLAARGVMQGYPDGTFRPDRPMTRAEFAAVLVRLLGLTPADGASAFRDVRPDAWYAGYVAALHQAGHVQGYADGTFRPGQELTREEAFVLIWRIVRDRLEVSGRGKTFADEAEISPWALEAVWALSAAGLIGGYEDGTLRPKQPITRAEAAVILGALMTD